jgi:general secretion pathway protein E
MNEHRSTGSAGARAYWVSSGGLTKCAALRRLVNAGLVDPAIGEQRVCSLDEDEITLA